jgi:hypothetical protein
LAKAFRTSFIKRKGRSLTNKERPFRARLSKTKLADAPFFKRRACRCPANGVSPSAALVMDKNPASKGIDGS